MSKVTAVTSLALRGLEVAPDRVQNIYDLVVDFRGESIFMDTTDLHGKIQERLDMFAVKLGYPHGISVIEVVNLMSYSLESFATLRYFRRASNMVNARDIFGYNFGLQLVRRPITNQMVSRTRDSIDQWLPTVSTRTPLAISNSIWSDLVGQLSEVLFVPAPILLYYSYLMDNIFTNQVNSDDGVSQVFVTRPSSIPANIEAIQTIISRANDALSASPLLRTFMLAEMGLDNQKAMQSFDWLRDLSGTTINYVSDDNLLYAIETTPTTYGITQFLWEDFADIVLVYSNEGVYYTSADASSVFEYDLQSNIHKFFIERNQTWGTSPLIYLGRIVSHYDSAHGHSMVYPPSVIRMINTELDSESLNNTLAQATHAMDLFPFDIPMRFNAEVVRITGPGVNTVQIQPYTGDPVNLPSEALRTGYNLFTLNRDTYSEVRTNLLYTIFFGGNFMLSMPVNDAAGINTLRGQEKVGKPESKDQKPNNRRRKRRKKPASPKPKD